MDEHEAAWAEQDRLNNELLWDISHAKYNPVTNKTTVPSGNPFREPKPPQQDDAIGPLRAIAVALLLCIPFWLAIGIAVWRHFHGR